MVQLAFVLDAQHLRRSPIGMPLASPLTQPVGWCAPLEGAVDQRVAWKRMPLRREPSVDFVNMLSSPQSRPGRGTHGYVPPATVESVSTTLYRYVPCLETDDGKLRIEVL